jgi:hypothetical protein
MVEVMPVRHDPWIYNGEKELADLLSRLKLHYEYESRYYPLTYNLASGRVCVGGFCPDFYLPASNERPGLNVELTFADHGRPNMLREQRLANLERVRIKRLKIELTRQRWGVDTILVTFATFQWLRRDDQNFTRLMRRSLGRYDRHHRGIFRYTGDERLVS